MNHTDYDYNGDGVIDSLDDNMEMLLFMDLCDSQERDERIDKIVQAIVRDGKNGLIGNAEFEKLCREEGLNANDFGQDDLREIQRRLG